MIVNLVDDTLDGSHFLFHQSFNSVFNYLFLLCNFFFQQTPNIVFVLFTLPTTSRLCKASVLFTLASTNLRPLGRHNEGHTYSTGQRACFPITSYLWGTKNTSETESCNCSLTWISSGTKLSQLVLSVCLKGLFTVNKLQYP